MKQARPRSQALLAATAITLSFIAACGGSRVQVKTAEDIEFDDQPAKTGTAPVLVLTPFAPSTHALWSSMRSEISGHMDVVTVEMTRDVTPELLHMRLESVRPACVVLVGNQAVRTYRTLQSTYSATPPAVVAMSSFAKQLTVDLRQTTGVAYEVPAVTSFLALRQLTSRSVARVGVVYRPAFAEFVGREAKLAEMENVELIGRSIDGKIGPRRIRLALRDLLIKERVDALWVLNDDGLLDPSHIRDGWLPEVRRAEVPIVVGVGSLVNPRLSFGSIAVVPDHAALGVQVANLLFELSDEEWNVGDREVELPLSIQTFVDMSQQHIMQLRPEADDLIDRKVSYTTDDQSVFF